MTAGPTIKFTVWRMNQNDDDYVGGAMLTGTSVYLNLEGRMQASPDDQILLQQGLETVRTFNMNVTGHWTIYERDEIEVTFPPNNPYINKRFRIVSVRYSDFSDPRRYMMLALQRSVKSHREQ